MKQLTPSWDLFNKSVLLLREHYLGVIYLLLLPSLVGALGNLLIGVVSLSHGHLDLSQTQMLGIALLVVSFVWQIINAGPLTYFALQAAGGKKAAALSTYYRQGLRYTPRLVLYYIAFALLLMGGLLLLIVPAFFVLRRYLLGAYYLVDGDLSVTQAFKVSGKRSKAVSGGIWGVVGVSLAIVMLVATLQALLSSIGLLIGELLACTTAFLLALRYRDIEPTKPKL